MENNYIIIYEIEQILSDKVFTWAAYFTYIFFFFVVSNGRHQSSSHLKLTQFISLAYRFEWFRSSYRGLFGFRNMTFKIGMSALCTFFSSFIAHRIDGKSDDKKMGLGKCLSDTLHRVHHKRKAKTKNAWFRMTNESEVKFVVHVNQIVMTI